MGVTAPLTPPPGPHNRSSHAADQAYPSALDGYGYGTPAPQDAVYGQDGPGMKTELREAAVVTVTVTVAGLLLGALWSWLAPHVPLVGSVVDNSWVVYLKDSEGEQAIGADGTFTLLALAFGALSGVAVFLWRRRGGVPLVVGLALGGLLASLVAWRLGVWLGPSDDVIAHAKAVGEGVTFPAPLKLGAKGAPLLTWPVAALVVHLALTALFGPRDPEPFGGYGVPPA